MQNPFTTPYASFRLLFRSHFDQPSLQKIVVALSVDEEVRGDGAGMACESMTIAIIFLTHS